MHIKRIIDYVKNEIEFSRDFCEDNVFVTLRIEPVLEIIRNLEEKDKYNCEYAEEIKKKDKIIDLMAEFINKQDIEENICMKNITKTDLCNEKYTNCINCIKQYFEKKATNDG